MVKSDSLTKAAIAFLKEGAISQVDLSDLAKACDQLIRAETQKSIPLALSLARQFVTRTRKNPNMPLDVALRAFGWTLNSSGNYKEAEKAYLEARKLSKSRPIDRAKIDRILIDVYMYLMDIPKARRRAQNAIKAFTKLQEYDEVAKTRINYGNLFHRQDRHLEAKRQYEQARCHLEKTNRQRLVLGLCHYNLANTLVQLLDFEKASESYNQAKDIFCKLGFNLYVTECEYGLGWLSLLKGDYHIALSLLKKCEESYLESGQNKGVMLCILDRAEAYLGLNLFSDAYDYACNAERLARKTKLNYEASKAAFFRAKAAYGCGRDKEVLKALDRAKSGFAKEKNKGFEAAVKLFETQITNNQKIDHRSYGSIRRLFKQAQLPLWEAVCDLFFITEQPNDEKAFKRLSKNKAVKSVPHLLAKWQTFQGDRQFLKGKVSVAAKHWTKAANVLDIVRAKLPPIEMRAAFMSGKSDPYEQMISLNIERDPRKAAIWADRFKTAGIWATSGKSFNAMSERTNVEQSLAKLSHQVSMLSGQLNSISDSRIGVALGSHRSLDKSHKSVRESLLLLDHNEQIYDEKTSHIDKYLIKYSMQMPIIQFHIDKNDIISFIHFKGTTRKHRYIDGHQKLLEMYGYWQILINRVLFGSELNTRSDVFEENKLFAKIGDYLWAPLEIPTNQKTVLIILDGILSNLPWSALSYNKEQLIEKYSIILSPTIQHFGHASRLSVKGQKMNIFVGEVGELKHTQKELNNITAMKKDISVFDPCSRVDWPEDGEWGAWHYIGHAQYRSDNPSYSSLSLKGEQLFGADFRLKNCKVNLVTLAACRTAHQSILPGEESTGIIRCLLEMGAKNVVGSHWAVSDKSTAAWMTIFYKYIFDGKSAKDSARLASKELKEKYHSAYYWAPFSVFGAG